MLKNNKFSVFYLDIENSLGRGTLAKFESSLHRVGLFQAKQTLTINRNSRVSKK